MEVASSSGYVSEADYDAEPRVERPVRIREPFLPMPQIELLFPEEEIHPEALRSAYNIAYFECATLPRRFILNVSDTVRSVMIVSHGADAVSSKNIQVFVVFEVQITTMNDLKEMFDDDCDEDDVGPMVRVRCVSTYRCATLSHFIYLPMSFYLHL